MNERILCAAIWLKDGRARTFGPTNVPTGAVVCGHRHHVCIQSVEELFQAGSIPERQRAGEHQGFLTRALIARAAGQIDRDIRSLTGEDLY